MCLFNTIKWGVFLNKFILLLSLSAVLLSACSKTSTLEEAIEKSKEYPMDILQNNQKSKVVLFKDKDKENYYIGNYTYSKDEGYSYNDSEEESILVSADPYSENNIMVRFFKKDNKYLVWGVLLDGQRTNEGKIELSFQSKKNQETYETLVDVEENSFLHLISSEFRGVNFNDGNWIISSKVVNE